MCVKRGVNTVEKPAAGYRVFLLTVVWKLPGLRLRRMLLWRLIRISLVWVSLGRACLLLKATVWIFGKTEKQKSPINTQHCTQDQSASERLQLTRSGVSESICNTVSLQVARQQLSVRQKPKQTRPLKCLKRRRNSLQLKLLSQCSPHLSDLCLRNQPAPSVSTLVVVFVPKLLVRTNPTTSKTPLSDVLKRP